MRNSRVEMINACLLNEVKTSTLNLKMFCELIWSRGDGVTSPLINASARNYNNSRKVQSTMVYSDSMLTLFDVWVVMLFAVRRIVSSRRHHYKMLIGLE